MKGGDLCPITRLAEALATTPEHEDRWTRPGGHAAVATRKRRVAVARYIRRVFCSRGEDRRCRSKRKQ